jgi:hypothetical protein
MPAEKQNSRAAPVVASSIVTLLLLPVLYVLSIGPAAWLIEHGYVSDASARWFYTPLGVLAERSEFLSVWLFRYIELFLK